MARYQRTQNAADKIVGDPKATVRGRQAVASPGDVPVDVGVMGHLSQALSGFFQGAQAGLGHLQNAELIEEYGKIEKQTADDKVAGALAGTTQAPADPEAMKRRPYADAYRGALGAAKWQKDAPALQSIIEGLSETDDPQAATDAFIKKQIQGADPLVELAYRKHAQDFAAQASFKWLAKKQEDAVGRAVQNIGDAVAGDLSSGVMPTEEMLKARISALEDALPVGKKDQARDKVLGIVLKHAGALDAPYLAEFMDRKLEILGNRSIRDVYPAEVQSAEQRALSRFQAVDSVRAQQDLNRIETAVTAGTLNIRDALGEILKHRANIGESAAAHSMTVKLIAELRKESEKNALIERAQQYAERKSGATPLSPTEMNDVGPALVKSILDAETKAGRSPDEAWARVGAVLAENNALPKAMKDGMQAELLSSDPARVKAAFGKLRVLHDAFGSNPTMFTDLVGDAGLVRWTIMDAEIKAGSDPTTAAARAAALKLDHPKDLQNIKVGDGKPDTLTAWAEDVVGAMKDLDTSMKRSGFSSSATVSSTVQRMIEDRIKVGVALFGEGGRANDREHIAKWAARSILGDIEASYDNGQVVWTKRVTPKTYTVDGQTVAGRQLDGEDMRHAKDSFGKLDAAMGANGANVSALTPRSDGKGYDVWVDGDGQPRRKAQFYAGQKIGNIDVPIDIPAYGYQPPEFKGTGYIIVPVGGGRTVTKTDDAGNEYTIIQPLVGVMYAGTTKAEKAAAAAEQAQADVENAADKARAIQQGEQEAGPAPGVLSEFQARQRGALGRLQARDEAILARGAEQRETSVGHHFTRAIQGIAERAADLGIISGDWMGKAGAPKIETPEDAQRFLDTLMRNARSSVRFSTTSGQSGYEVYRTQRLETIYRKEGYREYAYDDATGKTVGKDGATGAVTVGYGFNMERKDAREVFEKVLGISGENFDKIKGGGKPLTREQGIKLAEYALNQVEDHLERRLGKETVDALSRNQRLALVSLAYHGPALITRELVEHIKAGRMKDAAAEIASMSKRAKDMSEAAWRRRRIEEADLFAGLDGYTPRSPGSSSLEQRGPNTSNQPIPLATPNKGSVPGPLPVATLGIRG